VSVLVVALENALRGPVHSTKADVALVFSPVLSML
jgi:hypothetical protein